MTREQKYREQLQSLGIYDPAFDPAITELSQLDRDMKRARDAWAATVPKGCKPSLLDPHYQVICQLRRERLVLRESLGLTPKSLRRLRGAPDAPMPQDLITEKLTAIAEKVTAYGLPDCVQIGHNCEEEPLPSPMGAEDADD